MTKRKGESKCSQDLNKEEAVKRVTEQGYQLAEAARHQDRATITSPKSGKIGSGHDNLEYVLKLLIITLTEIENGKTRICFQC